MSDADSRVELISHFVVKENCAYGMFIQGLVDLNEPLFYVNFTQDVPMKSMKFGNKSL